MFITDSYSIPVNVRDAAGVWRPVAWNVGLERSRPELPLVLPGVTAEVTPLRDGVKEILVLDDPDAARDIAFNLSLDGLTARLNELGEIEYVDGGQVVAVTPIGFMEDSANEGSGMGRVDYRLEGPAATPTLHLDLDDDWLDSPDRVWPVRVDPSVHQVDSWNDDTFVMQNWPANWSTHPELRTGTDNSGAHRYRPFMHFSTGPLLGKEIVTAQLSLWGTHSPSCTARRINVRRVHGAWTGSTLTHWADQPASTEVTNAVVPGFGHPGCNPNGELFTFTGLIQTVQSWADGTTVNRGLVLRSQEEDINSFHRRFTSSSGPAGSTPPRLTVTWEEPAPSPPTITSHQEDQLVFATETLTAEPAPGGTVTSMQFRVDGTPVGAADSSAPYETAWDTTTAAEGSHELTVRANLSGGATIDSAPVTIEVGNATDSTGRLRADARAGRITDDQFVRDAIFSGFDQSAIPARYRSTTPNPLHPTESMMALLTNWELLDNATKQELLEAGQSSIEAAPPPPGPNPESGTGDCLDLFSGTVFEVEIEQLCRHRTEHLDLYYQVSGPWAVDGTDVDPANGRPDYIDDMGESMQAAYDVYVDMGLQPPAVDGSFYDQVPVIVADLAFGSDGFASPVGHPLILMPPADDEHYLGRHELFHLFQYNYISICDLEGFLGIGFACTGDRQSTIWWLEATAEWGAHQASIGLPTDEEPVGYARRIPDFLAEPSDDLSTYDAIVNVWGEGGLLNFGGPGGQPYGAVLFAEYLDLRFGDDFIVDTFDELDEGDNRSALEIIEDLLEGETASSFEELLPEFWSAAYLLSNVNDDGSENIYDVPSTDLQDWIEFVEDDTEHPQLEGDDFSNTPRLARRESIVSNTINAWSDAIDVEVRPGGSAVIEFLSLNGPQTIEFEVTTHDVDRLNKVRFTTIPFEDPAEPEATGTEFPKVCENDSGLPVISTVAPEDGVVVLEVPGVLPGGQRSCRGAALVLTHVDPDSDDDSDEFTVAARGVSNT